MLLIENGIVPPKEWEHDKFMKDVKKYTVAELLSKNKKIPSQYWMISEDENKWIFDRIKYNL